MKIMSEQLSAARRAKGYTQEQFAEMLHVSRQAVSHWENGRATPDLGTLQEIARLLDQPALLSPEEPAQPEAPQQPKSNRKALVLSASLLLVLLIVLVILVHTLGEKPRAEVVVTPDTPVAYRLRNSDLLWNVMFSIENVSDVPFTPDCVIACFYVNDQPDDSITLMGEQLHRYMGGKTLLRDNAPLLMPIGSDRPFYTSVVCHTYGTDENGHLLHFEGSCELEYAYAPEGE